MKLVTVCTPSHECLLERLQRSRIEEYALTVVRGPQIGDGVYKNPNWHDAMIWKLKAIQEQFTEDMVFVDADVVFLKPSLQEILEEAEDYDCMFQRDHNEYCAGLFFMRHTAKCVKLINDSVKLLIRDKREWVHDQHVLNWMTRHSETVHGYLSARFANLRILFGRDNCRKVQPIPVDKVIAFHANWLRGVADKVAQLDLVLESAKT